jgi:UPF0755 protein
VPVAVLLVAVLASLLLWSAWTRPGERGDPVEQVVTIPVGAGLQAITDTLQTRGLLRYPTLFRWAARLTGKDRHLQAGRYALPAGLAPRELLRRLVAGRTIPVRVVLPEGLEAVEIADLVGEALGFEPLRFLAAADSIARTGAVSRGLLDSTGAVARYDSLMRLEHPEGRVTLHWSEGYLGPDTYLFAEGTPPAKAADTIVGLGLARLDSLVRNGTTTIADLGLTPHQVLTLASIVETEARLPQERTTVAAVYVNRLRSGWRLEADPCVSFWLNKKGQRLFYKDLAVESPYNTYRNLGLPPGPICSPGPACIQAALRPADRRDLFFFVADGSGGHVFSRTRAEHERAVRQYRQNRRQSGH